MGAGGACAYAGAARARAAAPAKTGKVKLRRGGKTAHRYAPPASPPPPPRRKPQVPQLQLQLQLWHAAAALRLQVL